MHTGTDILHRQFTSSTARCGFEPGCSDPTSSPGAPHDSTAVAPSLGLRRVRRRDHGTRRGCLLTGRRAVDAVRDPGDLGALGDPVRPAPRRQSVIFVNGDGMAAAQREAGRLSIAGLDADLEMDELPTAGLLTTDSRDPAAFVTDSAAAATAWSTGQKTYNGAISVDVNKNPLQVLGEQAKAAGKATGLVTTAQVTDASPAAFFARTADRRSQDEIARQYLDESKPDVILGGGEDWWHPRGHPRHLPGQSGRGPGGGQQGHQGRPGRARPHPRLHLRR